MTMLQNCHQILIISHWTSKENLFESTKKPESIRALGPTKYWPVFKSRPVPFLTHNQESLFFWRSMVCALTALLKLTTPTNGPMPPLCSPKEGSRSSNFIQLSSLESLGYIRPRQDFEQLFVSKKITLSLCCITTMCCAVKSVIKTCPPINR